jgi:small GTP-binding protein
MAIGEQSTVLIKTLAVGSGAAGKTSLLITYTTGNFPSQYIPTDFDNYLQIGELDGCPYHLNLWDTGGGEDYERLRPLSYPQTDVFILLFDISSDEDMFETIHSYWWSELNHHCPDAHIVLVGSKIDLRNQEDKETISTAEGQAMADKIGAVKYMEVSSLEGRGVTELFDEVISLNLRQNVAEKKEKRCFVL